MQFNNRTVLEIIMLAGTVNVNEWDIFFPLEKYII